MEETIVSYGKGAQKCEIICRKGAVSLFRQGKLSREDVLITDVIYKNAQKGDEAPRSLIESVCGTGDPLMLILTSGEYNLSTAELRVLRDQAFQGVVAYIKRNYINPVGNREYTDESIKTVLDAVKVRGTINYREDAEANFNRVKKKILGKLPLKPKPGCIPYSATITWHQHSKLYNQFKAYLKSETPTSDGRSVVVEMLVPPKDIDRIIGLLE
jgi:ribosome maturation protein SDO1